MKIEKAKLVVEGLKEAGVDFTAGVPDAQFIQVYKMLEEDPDIRYVGTANEAEAAGVGYGAWFGGKKPALMLATSGLLVATYHLARINILHEVPLLIVIPYRGDIGDPRWMGLYKKTTEPGLNAMDIPYRVVSRSSDIVRTIKECNESAARGPGCDEYRQQQLLLGGAHRQGSNVVSFHARHVHTRGVRARHGFAAAQSARSGFRRKSDFESRSSRDHRQRKSDQPHRPGDG